MNTKITQVEGALAMTWVTVFVAVMVYINGGVWWHGVIAAALLVAFGLWLNKLARTQEVTYVRCSPRR